MAHEAYHLVPLTVDMGSLLAVDDIAQVMVPSVPGMSAMQIDACDWSMSVRGLVSGTVTMNCKTGDGTIVASKAMNAAGVGTFTPTTSMVNSGDRLRFGFSGVGVGLTDVTVTCWLKMPSIS